MTGHGPGPATEGLSKDSKVIWCKRLHQGEVSKRLQWDDCNWYGA